MPRARAVLRWLLFLGGVVYLLPRDSRRTAAQQLLDAARQNHQQWIDLAETCRILSGDRDLDARP